MTKQCSSCGGDCGRTKKTGCRYRGNEMNTDRELLQQVHSLAEAARCLGISQVKGDNAAIDHWNAEVDAICARLSQPEERSSEIEQEPVAWFAFADQNGPLPLELYGWDEKACKHAVLTNARTLGWKGTVEGYLMQQGWTLRPLYTAPQQAQKPLTAHQIRLIRGQFTNNTVSNLYVRAIEAAHNIK